MKCRILADHHEFGRKSQEVIPEKPKMCLKSPRVTVYYYLYIYRSTTGDHRFGYSYTAGGSG